MKKTKLLKTIALSSPLLITPLIANSCNKTPTNKPISVGNVIFNYVNKYLLDKNKYKIGGDKITNIVAYEYNTKTKFNAKYAQSYVLKYATKKTKQNDTVYELSGSDISDKLTTGEKPWLLTLELTDNKGNKIPINTCLDMNITVKNKNLNDVIHSTFWIDSKSTYLSFLYGIVLIATKIPGLLTQEEITAFKAFFNPDNNASILYKGLYQGVGFTPAAPKLKLEDQDSKISFVKVTAPNYNFFKGQALPGGTSKLDKNFNFLVTIQFSLKTNPGAKDLLVDIDPEPMITAIP